MRLLDQTLTAAQGPPRPSAPRARRMSVAQAATVLVAGLLFTFAGWILGRIYVDSELADRRQELADAVRDSIDRRILVYFEALTGVQSLFSASIEVTRLEFHRYVDRLRSTQQYEGIQAVSFNRYVSATDREALEKRVRADTSLNPAGNPSFSVHPSTDQPFSLVVDYIEPLEGNERAFGFDVASDALRLRAALRARDTGRPQATAPIELVQETGSQMSILYFLPVYVTGLSSRELSDRRSAFQGLVTGVIRMDDFLYGSLHPQHLAACDFEIQDAGVVASHSTRESGGSITLFANRARRSDPDGARGRAIHVPPIEVGGRTWRLVFHQIAIQAPAALRGLPALILAVGSVISLLVAAIVFTLGSRARTAEMVHALTADLARSAAETRILTAVVADSLEGILVTDREGTIVDVNDAWCRITGFSRQEAIGSNPKLLQSEWQGQASYETLWRTLTESGHWTGELWDRRKDGSVYAVRSSIRSVTDAEGQVTHYVGTQYDVTDYLQNNERAMFLANHDALTGLPRQGLLMDRIRQAISEAKRSRDSVVLIYLDLDGFKPINDALGHFAGDKVLQEVSGRLSSCVRQHDTVARLGGDEFVVLLTSDADRKRANALVTEISQCLAEPMTILGRSVKISASMGIAIYPDDARQAELLVRTADMAMYSAKSKGMGGYRFAERSGHAALDVRRALDEDQFVLYYQPELALDSGRVTGFEALLRWRHPERGLLLPADFLQEAESEECGTLIGEWVLNGACQQAREWQAVGSSQLTVAVNSFSSQLFDPGFRDIVREALDSSGLHSGLLELEIDEQQLLRMRTHQVTLLEDICRLGVRLTLDSFGSGTTPLSILSAARVSKVKIHGPRVREALEEPRSMEMLRAIISSVRQFEILVVAEGVETHEQLDLLRGLGCNACLGRVYQEPLPAGEVAAFLAQRTS